MASVFKNRKGLMPPTLGDILLNCTQKRVTQKTFENNPAIENNGAKKYQKCSTKVSKHGIYTYLITLLLFQNMTEVIRILPITKNSLMTMKFIID